MKKYVDDKVASWVEEIDSLCQIAQSQPHAAYAAFTNGVMSKWNFVLRTIPNIQNSLQPLEDIIQRRFLPTITGQNHFSQQLRSLMALPARTGGIGIRNPVSEATAQHKASLKITRQLVELILKQSKTLPPETFLKQREQKLEVRASNRQAQETATSHTIPILPTTLKKAVEMSREKGASSWLTVLPIEEHGFTLHKRDFRDTLCLRYGWPPPLTPSHCVCNKRFTLEHTLSCPHGGFPSIRHNEIRNITAHLMSEVCHKVGIEPTLQPLSGETISYQTANSTDGARLDVKAQGFWGCETQCAFFDVRVFNPLAHSYHNTSLANSYRKNEQEKCRAYDQRVREVEHGCFSPLVFSVAGGMGPSATVVYKRLATMISTKFNQQYSQTINWLRCRLTFSLLWSEIMCIRESRSSAGYPAHPILSEVAIDHAIHEGHGTE